MVKKHLFSLNAPANWPIERKERNFITRPSPGPHSLYRCLPLSLLIKNILKYAETTREVKAILNSGYILIDNKIRKDHKFPVGIMDVIQIKKTNENFRVIINKDNRYELNRINQEEAKLKPCKIINKKILKKGKIQLNLFDGRNILVDKNDYKVGDTLILDLEKNKIIKHLKLEKGSTVYITDGKYSGYLGKLENIIKKGMQRNTILFKADKEKLETLKDYAFAIPEDMIK